MKLHNEHEALEGIRPQIQSLSDNGFCFVSRDYGNIEGQLSLEFMTSINPVVSIMSDFYQSSFSHGEKEVASSCLIYNCQEILHYLDGFGLSIDQHDLDDTIGLRGAITIYRASAHKNTWKLFHGVTEALDKFTSSVLDTDKNIFHPKLSQKQEYFFQLLGAHINALNAIIKDVDIFQERLLDVLNEDY